MLGKHLEVAVGLKGQRTTTRNRLIRWLKQERRLQEMYEEQQTLKENETRIVMHANANVQKLKDNDDQLAKHERWLQEMRDEQQKIKGNELLVVKDLLMLQQHREERLKIVEQQSHNAEELKEQTSLFQELRKEIDKLRNEQEKIKDNERRDRDEKGNGEKIEPYVFKSADRRPPSLISYSSYKSRTGQNRELQIANSGRICSWSVTSSDVRPSRGNQERPDQR